MSHPSAPQRPPEARHVTVYARQDEFAAWPFSHGLWAFPDGEVLVGFSRGPCRYTGPHDVRHDVVDGLDGEYVTLRSGDGGRTWPAEGLQVLGTRRGFERALRAGLARPARTPPWTSPPRTSA